MRKSRSGPGFGRAAAIQVSAWAQRERRGCRGALCRMRCRRGQTKKSFRVSKARPVACAESGVQCGRELTGRKCLSDESGAAAGSREQCATRLSRRRRCLASSTAGASQQRHGSQIKLVRPPGDQGTRPLARADSGQITWGPIRLPSNKPAGLKQGRRAGCNETERKEGAYRPPQIFTTPKLTTHANPASKARYQWRHAEVSSLARPNARKGGGS